MAICRELEVATMNEVTNEFVSDVAFTSAVKDVQSRLGSRNGYANMERGRGWANTITNDLRAFIARRSMIRRSRSRISAATDNISPSAT